MTSRPYISDDLRLLVANRADYLCEYCLIAEVDTFFGCQIDHVISLKHGGSTTAHNLAYACAICNRQKGSDLGSIDWRTGELVRFFNPRTDNWSEHFQLEMAVIQARSSIGEVTARIFEFNSDIQVIERQILIAEGRYPTQAAKSRMRDNI